MASVSSDAAGEWQRNWNKIKGDLAIAKETTDSDTRKKIRSEYKDEMTNTWSNIIVLYQLYNHRHLYQSTFAAAAKNAPLTSAEFRENFHKLRIICEMTEFTMAVQHLQMQMVRFNLKYKKLKEGQSLQCDVNVLQEFGDDTVDDDTEDDNATGDNQFNPENRLKALVTDCDPWLEVDNQKIKDFITTDQSKYIKYGVLKTLMEEKEEKLRRVLEKVKKIFFQFMDLNLIASATSPISIQFRIFYYNPTKTQLRLYSAAPIGFFGEALQGILSWSPNDPTVLTIIISLLLVSSIFYYIRENLGQGRQNYQIQNFARLTKSQLVNRTTASQLLNDLNIDATGNPQITTNLIDYLERFNLVQTFTKLQNISNQIDAGEQFVHFLCHVISSYRITN